MLKPVSSHAEASQAMLKPVRPQATSTEKGTGKTSKVAPQKPESNCAASLLWRAQACVCPHGRLACGVLQVPACLERWRAVLQGAV